MNEEVKELMLTIPQTIVAYDANPKGQHLYDDQRLQIAKTLYNAGYRKSPSYPIMTEFEVKAIMKEQLQPIVRELTIQEVGKAKINAVKEFASSVVYDILNHKYISDSIQNILFHLINDKLNDFLNCIETEDKR